MLAVAAEEEFRLKIRLHLTVHFFLEKTHRLMFQRQPAFDNETCLQALLGKDDLLLDALIVHFQPQVAAYLRKLNAKPQEAQDIFFIAIEAIWEKSQQDGFKLTGDFSTLLFSICKYQWYKIYRRKKITAEGVSPEDLDVPFPETGFEQVLEKTEQFDFIEEKLNNMAGKCRKLLIRRFREEASQAEIVAEFGYANSNAASQRVHRCLERLKKMVKEDDKFAELFGQPALQKIAS